MAEVGARWWVTEERLREGTRPARPKEANKIWNVFNINHERVTGTAVTLARHASLSFR
jgi:hypothetical protein